MLTPRKHEIQDTAVARLNDDGTKGVSSLEDCIALRERRARHKGHVGDEALSIQELTQSSQKACEHSRRIGVVNGEAARGVPGWRERAFSGGGGGGDGARGRDFAGGLGR